MFLVVASQRRERLGRERAQAVDVGAFVEQRIRAELVVGRDVSRFRRRAVRSRAPPARPPRCAAAAAAARPCRRRRRCGRSACAARASSAAGSRRSSRCSHRRRAPRERTQGARRRAARCRARRRRRESTSASERSRSSPGSARLGFQRNGQIGRGRRDAVRRGVVARRGRVVERLGEQRVPKVFLASALARCIARQLDADCGRGQAQEKIRIGAPSPPKSGEPTHVVRAGGHALRVGPARPPRRWRARLPESAPRPRPRGGASSASSSSTPPPHALRQVRRRALWDLRPMRQCARAPR